MSESIAYKLEHALRSLLTASTPDPLVPKWQNDAYLQTVAIPRAREALEEYKARGVEWEIPPLDDEQRWILGRPNFECGSIAVLLRGAGHEIPRKAEAEQAYVIHWALCLYLRHGAKWRDEVGKVFDGAKA